MTRRLATSLCLALLALSPAGEAAAQRSVTAATVEHAGPTGGFTSVTMSDDGAGADAVAGDGVFTASVTAHTGLPRFRFTYTLTAVPAMDEEEDVGTTPATLYINELMAANNATFADPQGDYDDWIELYNSGGESIDMSGMYLSDDADEPRKWRFPLATTIAAGGYVLVWADNDTGDTPGLHANFKLSSGGESVVLSDVDERDNAVIDRVDFPELEDDEAYGRSTNGGGTFEVLSTPSPGAAVPPRPDPTISIEAGHPAVEGGAATFTVGARPAPTEDLAVLVTVTQGAGQDFLPASPPTSVVVTASADEATLIVTLPEDTTDEANGVLTATLGAGTGYISGSPASASLAVRDNDGGPAVPRVAINELMAANDETIADPQDDYEDWIELFNTTPQAIDLAGMYLSDDPKEPRKWRFPAGATIAAGGYLLVWADADTDDTPGLHADFKLSAGGESVVLTGSDAGGNAVIDRVDFPELEDDEALGRLPNGSGPFRTVAATPGAENAAASTETVDDNDGVTAIVSSPPSYRVREGDTEVGTLTATNSGGDASDPVWSIPSGTGGGEDGDKFTLTPAGALAFAAPKDFEHPDDADADGSYQVTVQVIHGTVGSMAALTVTLTNRNEAPTADAGADQADIEPGTTVTLNGAGTDPDAGDALGYAWTQTGGPRVALSDAAGAAPTFTAPRELAEGATLAFTVRVTDRGGLYHEDTVLVSVNAAVPPSDDAYLSALTLSGVDFGAFDPATTEYGGAVPHALDATTVAATPRDPAATVAVTPADAAVALAVGANTIRVAVTAEDGVTQRAYTVTVTRADLPQATIAAQGPVREGDAAPFTVTLDVPAPGALTVSVTVTESGAALSGAQPTEVTFDTGDTAATLTVATLDDTVIEADSQLTATLATGTGYRLGAPASATLTVTDNDEPAFAVSLEPAALTEGEVATLTVALTNAVTFADARTLAVAVTGVAADDYILTPEAPTLAAGATAATARFAAAADGEAEEPETARLEVSLDGTVLGAVEATITDPATPTVRVRGVPQVGETLTVLVGDAEPAKTAAVVRTSAAGASTASGGGWTPSAAGTVEYQWLRDGEDIPGATGASHRLTALDAGRPITVRVDRLGLSSHSAPTVAVWDLPGNPELAEDEEELLSAEVVLEWHGDLRLDMAGYARGLRGASFGRVSPERFDLDGVGHAVRVLAVNGVGQFALATTPLPDNAEENLVAYWDARRMDAFEEQTIAGLRLLVTPYPRGDGDRAWMRRYEPYWDAASDGVRVAVSLRRRFELPEATVTAAETEVDEGSEAVFEVSLSTSARKPLTVPMEVSDAGVGVSEPVPASVSFAVGERTALVRVATSEDRVSEADGEVTLSLLAGAGYTLGGGSSATVAVADDDSAAFAVTADPAEVAEGGAATVSVAISNGVTFAQDLPVSLSVSGTVRSSDYALSLSELLLPAGSTSATASFEALRDGEAEPAETATVAASVDGAAVGSADIRVPANAAASSDASLSSLTLTDVDIGEFEPEMTEYAGSAGSEVAVTTVEAVPGEADASVVIEDAAGSTVGPRRTTQLAVGVNEITATVTAPDAETTRTYAVTVTRAPGWGDRLPARDIELGPGSSATGLWSDGTALWVVSDWLFGTIRSFDLETGAEPGGAVTLDASEGYVSAIWSDGETLWGAGYYGGVDAYRLSDGARLADRDLDRYVLSEAGNEQPMGLWSDGETLWVADYADGRLYGYRLSDGAREAERDVPLGGAGSIHPWGVWSDGETVLAAHWTAGMVRAYRLSDGRPLAELDIDTGVAGNDSPRGLWSDGETLWVTDEWDSRVYAYAVPGLGGGSGSPAPVSSQARHVPSAMPGAAVTIPDAALRGRVASALGKEPGAMIGTAELAALTALNARGAGIRDLSGLEHASHLAVLDVGGNRITDLWPLAGLRELRELRADGNRIVDLWPLSGLSSLRSLDMRDNAVADFWPVTHLPRLETLDARGNPGAAPDDSATPRARVDP